jgi:hypothetical protein
MKQLLLCAIGSRRVAKERTGDSAAVAPPSEAAREIFANPA